MLWSLRPYNLPSQRQAGELDESVLELTSQILGANPDFATLWNCRREVLQQLEAQKCVLVQCLITITGDGCVSIRAKFSSRGEES